MPEPIALVGRPTSGIKPDLSVVSECLTLLHTAFPRTVRLDPQRLLTVYRNGLTGYDDEAIAGAVDKIIREDQHFPRVARLREVAHEWTRRNRASAEVIDESDPLACGVCNERATWRARWRPKCGGDPSLDGVPTHILLTADRTAIVLERYERLLCACAVPCEYEPDSAADDTLLPTMAVMKLPVHAQLRIQQQCAPTGTGARSAAAGWR